MDPKLKVFLSSAQYEDEFKVEREVLRVLFDKEPLQSTFLLWKIEDQASPLPIQKQYPSHVMDSDVVTLLLGKTLRPAVVKEFETASLKGIPVFAFIRKPSERDSSMEEFIRNRIQNAVTTSEYSEMRELCEKVENSLQEYYFRNRYHHSDDGSKAVSIVHQTIISNEEKALRLLVGVITGDSAALSREKIIEALILEGLLKSASPLNRSDISSFIMASVRSGESSLIADINASITALLGNDALRPVAGERFEITAVKRQELEKKQHDTDEAQRLVLYALFEKHSVVLPGVNRDYFAVTIQNAVSHIIADVAFLIAEAEFSGDKNPLPYDADELNRMATKILIELSPKPGGIGAWQNAVVDILRSNNKSVISWINRLRKGYWLLATIGCEPNSISYRKQHFHNYVVYLDSHVAIRSMVGAGDDSSMCREIVNLSRSLGVTMRLSQPMFREVESAFKGANDSFHSSDCDIGRALDIYKALGRKSDIFDGFVESRSRNSRLSWDSWLNQYFSAANKAKLKHFIEKEMGIEIQSEDSLSSDQLNRIQNLEQRLLKSRRINITDQADPERREGWTRQHTLRTNEAQQMALIYELRESPESHFKQYWFVTFDTFVYEVSAQLANSGESFYAFPCYMKPGRWLEILLTANPDIPDINTFREILCSATVAHAADYVEAEVISQMLKARVDQTIRDVETLRFMFQDIVNRPAVQDAFDEMRRARGGAALDAARRAKELVIEELGNRVKILEAALTQKNDEIQKAAKSMEKAKNREKYYRKELSKHTKKRK